MWLSYSTDCRRQRYYCEYPLLVLCGEIKCEEPLFQYKSAPVVPGRQRLSFDFAARALLSGSDEGYAVT
eukprot:2577610-Rhodomonas_salina.1